MDGEKRESWMELCAQAADEKDPQKLMKLIAEIIRLLHEKHARLDEGTVPSELKDR
jgi:hypothetical protein